MIYSENPNHIFTSAKAAGQVAAESFRPDNGHADPSLYAALVAGLSQFDIPVQREAYEQGFMIGVELELLTMQKTLKEANLLMAKFVDQEAKRNEE